MQLLRDLVQLSQLHPARGSPRPPEVDQRREVAGSHVYAPRLEHREVVRVLEDARRHLGREQEDHRSASAFVVPFLRTQNH